MASVKQKLIDATFEEVFTKGFNAASLSNILHRANVKKGAMYHYFPSKKAMALEMIDEKISKRVDVRWSGLVDDSKDEIETLTTLLNNLEMWDFTNGCPLGNLLQESLNQDEDFTKALYEIVQKWKNILKDALQSAKDKNILKQSTDIEQCATFIIASYEGALLMTKKSKNSIEFEKCMMQLTIYLNSLRK